MYLTGIEPLDMGRRCSRVIKIAMWRESVVNEDTNVSKGDFSGESSA